MRTTLDIDEDVLLAAKELARRQNLSAGQVVSRLLRQVLTDQSGHSGASEGVGFEPRTIAGFRPFPGGKAIVTNNQVNQLREVEGV
jgi:hypothetical protein